MGSLIRFAFSRRCSINSMSIRAIVDFRTEPTNHLVVSSQSVSALLGRRYIPIVLQQSMRDQSRYDLFLRAFVDLIVLVHRYDSELCRSFHGWQRQLSRRSNFGSISIRVFCKCPLSVRERHCARRWNSSPTRKANVMNNTFRLMKSIYLLMKHVEISLRGNQPSY